MFLRSLKHYTVDLLVEGLQKVSFLNYKHYSNIDAAYTDFLNNLMKVTNKIVPSKEIRIKNNNQDWFHREVADLTHVQKILFLKFKKSKLHIDEEIYKKIRNQVQKLIKEKKQNFYKINLEQKIINLKIYGLAL